MTQASLFAPEPNAESTKPTGDRPQRMKALIVVKAAPNPSQAYGETVCVAALRLDIGKPGWLRLYPINFRDLEQEAKFKKYDIVELDARPAHNDPRHESWRPLLSTMRTLGHLKPGPKRLSWIADYIEDSMCDVFTAVKADPPARSLAAIRPRSVDDFKIESHPGWTAEEQRKIDAYVSQLDLLESGPRRALEAPRFKAWYHYRCHARTCKGHKQGVLDWELVAHQRHLAGWSEAAAKDELRKRWLENMCGPDRDTVFYVGNQAKRQHVFSVLGVLYPRR